MRVQLFIVRTVYYGAMLVFLACMAPLVLVVWEVGAGMRGLEDKWAKSAQEQTYANLCPDYRDASTWRRWTDGYIRKLSWCANYVDRLPPK